MKTETELKKTRCPFFQVRDDGDGLLIDPSVQYSDCIGLACSQCVDCGPVRVIGPAHDITEHKSPDDDPNKPEGEGWKVEERLGHRDRWVRETGDRQVYCGRNTGEALRQEVASAIEHLIGAINNR